MCENIIQQPVFCLQIVFILGRKQKFKPVPIGTDCFLRLKIDSIRFVSLNQRMFFFFLENIRSKRQLNFSVIYIWVSSNKFIALEK